MARTTKRTIPTHPEGWKFAGACGAFLVWHAGKMDYRVTFNGEVVAFAEQLSPAHVKAQRLYNVAKFSAAQEV